MQHVLESWFALLADASLKSLGLAALVAMLVAVLRLTNPHLRHQLWTAVALGMLLLPLLAPLLPGPRLPIPNWRRAPLTAAADIGATASESSQSSAEIAARSARQVVEPPPSVDGAPPAAPGSLARQVSGVNERSPSSAPTPAGRAPVIAAAAPAGPTNGVAASGRSRANDSVAMGLGALFALWATGVTWCGSRLLLGMLGVLRLRREARPIDPSRLAGNTLPAGLRIAESPRVHVPLLVGWRRPCVLLPTCWTNWSESRLLAVLSHESMHARRGDTGVRLLLAAVVALYWFHPLAWWLRRELERLAEEACDDAALASTHDRPQYARLLLEMSQAAAGQQGRLCGAAVSMASQGDLRRRIELVLDVDRPLATPHGANARRLVGALAATAIASFAAVRLQSESIASPPLELLNRPDAEAALPISAPALQQSGQPAGPAQAAGVQRGAVKQNLEGTCIDADSQPVAGARVRLFETRGEFGKPRQVAEANSDEQGRFAFADLDPPYRATRTGVVQYLLVASAAGRPDAVGSFFGDRPQRLQFAAAAGDLRGVVLDPSGRPLPGAEVSVWSLNDHPIPGLAAATTDSEGRFLLRGLPATPDTEQPYRLPVTVRHPDYPTLQATSSSIPGELTIRVEPGHVIEGLATVSGKPLPDVLVRLEPHLVQAPLRKTVTDATGRFHIAVRPGVYDIVVVHSDFVAPAVVAHEGKVGQTSQLPPFAMVTGGWIAGRVINTKTNQPLGLNDDGVPVAVSLYGPSRPQERAIRGDSLAVTDADGNYRLRALPGENYPFLVNLRGERMAWDTWKQPAVVVRDGETTEYDLRVTPKPTPEELIAASNQVIAELPANGAERTRAILERLRTTRIGDEMELGGALLRELARQGRDAVPLICAELDETNTDGRLRNLAFVLRAIGDPRDVPALIRAIPRTLLPSSSDFGLIAQDHELLKFLQQHDLDSERGQYYGYGRPVREVFGALHSLTKQDFADQELHSVMRRSDPRGVALQERLYLRQARRWERWWSEHWREFTDDDSLARIALPDDPAVPEPKPLDAWRGAKKDFGAQGAVLSPASERGQYVDYFLDLDTGYSPRWPAHIRQEESALDSPELARWADANGIDLMCVVHRAEDGAIRFVLRSFGMRLFELDRYVAETLERRLAEEGLPSGRPLSGALLLPADPTTKQPAPGGNGVFLCQTREGGVAVVEVTDRVTQRRDLTGLPAGMPQEGVGFHLGVRFTFRVLAEP